MSQLSRTPAANAAATATQSLSTLLANLRASMQRLPNAWAHRVSTANKSYLAASAEVNGARTWTVGDRQSNPRSTLNQVNHQDSRNRTSLPK